MPDVVSIHARLATGDDLLSGLQALSSLFQFTPVLRRATRNERETPMPAPFQFTPVLRRATPYFHRAYNLIWFQFTPVLRRATLFPILTVFFNMVSIHARLATGDMLQDQDGLDYQFQFTPVLRRATERTCGASLEYKFQFTPVLRRATIRRVPAVASR